MFAIQESHQLPDTMFTLSRVGETAVVSLTCPCIRERQSEILGRYLRELAPEVGGRLILEVAGVGQFACAWINTLVEVSRTCQREGGRLVVQGMSKKDVRMVKETGLDRYITLAVNRQDAMQHFSRAGVVRPWRLAVARLLDLPSAA